MKIGVIGAGVIGELRARSVAADPATQLVAVADVDENAARRAAAAGGAKAYADPRAMIDAGGIDAVIVSSPVQFHEEHCTAAFEAGLHVLCEKPLSNSYESARRIFDRGREAGRTLAVGFNHRYYPSIRYLKEVVDSGELGPMNHLRVFGGHDGLANFRAEWQYQGKVSGGGAMMDVGIHMTDLARFIAGEVDTVFGIWTNRVWNVEESEDNAMAIFRTESGVDVTYQATWDEWRGYRFYVDAYGDRGYCRGYYAPMTNETVTADKPGGQRSKKMRRYPEIILREKLKGWQTTSYLSFQDELRDFLPMVEGRATALADGWSGVRAIEIAAAVRRSHETREAVHLTKRPT